MEPEGDWTTWCILAGRGYGKTRTGSETVNRWAEEARFGRIALVAEDPQEAREVMIEGESGILARSPPWFKPSYSPALKRVVWPNGVRATVYSAEDPESLRGPQFGAAWCDELAKWRYGQETWDNLQFGMRLGDHPRQIVTTTPRPTKLMRAILARPDTHVTSGSTYENLMNLAQAFRTAVVDKYEGTRLGKQELHAKMLDDNPYALWNLDEINKYRIETWPDVSLGRTVVAIDPPISSGENADECGIIAASLGSDGHGYVMDDYSVQGEKPLGWAMKALELYQELNADAIVAEANQGGEMVETVIRQAGFSGRIKLVHATKGKRTRAEPISALYEQGRVHHVGILSKLEDQMCDFTSDFDSQTMGYSPDRVDALVWALTELMLDKQGGTPRVRSL